MLLAKRGPCRRLTIQPRQIHRPVHDDGPIGRSPVWNPGQRLLQTPPRRDHDPIGVRQERTATDLEPEPLEQAAVGQPPRIEAAMRHGPIPPAVLLCPRLSPCRMAAKQRVHDEQVGVRHGRIGPAGGCRRHHAAIAGEPARATAEAAHRHVLLDADAWASPVVNRPVVKRKNRRGERPRKILHGSVEAAVGGIMRQADIADSHRHLSRAAQQRRCHQPETGGLRGQPLQPRPVAQRHTSRAWRSRASPLPRQEPARGSSRHR